MPELPEVETIAQKLSPALVGHEVVQVDVGWDRTIDRPDVVSFRKALIGSRFTGIGRRGKFLVMDLDTGQSLLVHLRMSGKFSLSMNGDVEAEQHTRLRLRLDNGLWVVYIDPRKFGRFYLVDDPQEIVADLGPEPLGPDFTAEALWERLQNRRGEIKRLLLDQQFIAGLGNIYVSEALWQARIHPARPANSLSGEECYRLHGAIVDVLRLGIVHGGTSLEDRQYVYPDGGTGEHQHHLSVYDRAGDRCRRCGYELQRIVQGQRSTYFCPVCQPYFIADGSAARVWQDENLDEERKLTVETKTLNIAGMSCNMCVKHVTHALKNVDGVVDVHVQLEPPTATVTYDPQVADLAAFKAAVAEADYEVVGEA
ncbi:MAG: bifunctional DNA-formamidopyrimidine glycosylase/DNA-(apurinic or apyrimidinic site) lyase [Anaerolineae bacterium]|nr:bifunctional DNA-formamidopyrimidine glycosylase/DNA-(apurinic or apyrimidinic site) lyase [Anaerolineae bacterium]